MCVISFNMYEYRTLQVTIMYRSSHMTIWHTSHCRLLCSYAIHHGSLDIGTATTFIKAIFTLTWTPIKVTIYCRLWLDHSLHGQLNTINCCAYLITSSLHMYIQHTLPRLSCSLEHTIEALSTLLNYVYLQLSASLSKLHVAEFSHVLVVLPISALLHTFLFC